MRVPRTITNPEDPNSIADQLGRAIQTLDNLIEFGEPQDPSVPTSTTRPGGTGTGAHNGTRSNIMGSWAEGVVTSAGRSTVTFTHNLYLDNPHYALPVSGEPNVRWLNFGWMHDGTGIAGGTATRLELDVVYMGGTVSANAIALEVMSTLTDSLTINADHPIVVTLFFTKATRL